MLELRAKNRVEATTLEHIVGTYLAEFVKDLAQETLKAGLLAKRRAEDEVTTPAHRRDTFRLCHVIWSGSGVGRESLVEAWSQRIRSFVGETSMLEERRRELGR